MRHPALQPVIYRRLFPRPQPTDPVDFTQFVAKCIIPEVRQETRRFYGPEETIESNYPGLDYASKAHRTRLRLFTWHRRLLRIFEELKLTESEIHSICTWEGTKYSKEKYEREHGYQIQDTTWHGVKAYDEPRLKVRSVPSPTNVSYSRLRGGRVRGGHMSSGLSDESELAYETSETDDDVITNSIGTALHQHLVAATAARTRGEPAVLDSAWEQWMKDVTERGLIRSYPGSNAAAGPSNWSHTRQAYSPPLSNVSTSSHLYSPSNPLYGTSSMNNARYLPSSASYSSRSQASEAHRGMAPPPLHPLPRIRATASSSHPRSSASPAS